MLPTMARLLDACALRPGQPDSGLPHPAAPVHQSDSALFCSSAPHPSDPQPPNLTTKREKTDIPTLLSADILALRLQGLSRPDLPNRCPFSWGKTVLSDGHRLVGALT